MDFDNGTALGLATAEYLRQHLVKPRVREGFSLEAALTEGELAAAEERFGFEFADHRALPVAEVTTVTTHEGWR